MKRLLTIVFAIALAGSAAAPPAGATTGASHWPRAVGRLVVPVENGLGPRWTPAVTRAVELWNANPYVRFVLTGPGSCDFTGPLGVVELCRAHLGSTGPLALTYMFVYHDTLRFDFGHIDVNVDKRWRTKHKRFGVSCHELGHALGLGHRPERSSHSCMVARFRYMDAPIAPDATDFADLAALYAPSAG
jgi:Matrixin